MHPPNGGTNDSVNPTYGGLNQAAIPIIVWISDEVMHHLISELTSSDWRVICG